MTEREKLYRGIGRVAFGYVFLYFNVNINGVSLMPAFVGYILFLLAIGDLAERERELSLLFVPGVILALWNGVSWLFSFGGGSLEGRIPVAGILICLLNLYFQFQLLTNLATLAEASEPEGANLGGRIRTCRTAQTVMLTVMSALGYLLPLIGEEWAVLTVLIAILYIIVGIILIKTLFDLRRLFREDGTPEA